MGYWSTNTIVCMKPEDRWMLMFTDTFPNLRDMSDELTSLHATWVWQLDINSRRASIAYHVRWWWQMIIPRIWWEQWRRLFPRQVNSTISGFSPIEAHFYQPQKTRFEKLEKGNNVETWRLLSDPVWCAPERIPEHMALKEACDTISDAGNSESFLN